LRSRDPDKPWNPAEAVEITPDEYERQVRDWLKESEGEPTNIEVGHLERITGSGGEYEFDVVARFSRFAGAEFTVLVECKRYRNAVNRDLVLALYAKLLDVRAHKAMMFSTGGFQRGTIEYAAEYNIALITLKDGRASYETRNDGPPVEPPPWVDLPRFFGERLSVGDRGIRMQRVENGDVRAISTFLSDL
jgi:restriction system protein